MNRKAFTLLELIVSAAILLIIFSGFTYLIRTGTTSIKKANNLASSINTIQAKLEELKSLSFEELINLRDPAVQITPISADLLEIGIGKIYTMRSKY